jgi:[ribosomal protein S5]-alanine N-acetyltransferase
MSISKTAEPIRTERLLLRPAREEDLDAFFTIMSDPRAMRHWSTLPHESPEVTLGWMEPLFHPPGQGFEWVMELNGAVIGKAGGYSLPEVGFILHPDHWSRGYVTEAMQAIIPVLFAMSDVPALTADVDPLNQGSLKVLAKLGFIETHRAERTFNLGGVWADSVYLALPRA